MALTSAPTPRRTAIGSFGADGESEAALRVLSTWHYVCGHAETCDPGDDRDIFLLAVGPERLGQAGRSTQGALDGFSGRIAESIEASPAEPVVSSGETDTHDPASLTSLDARQGGELGADSSINPPGSAIG